MSFDWRAADGIFHTFFCCCYICTRMDNGNEHMRLNVRPACRGRLAASVFFSIFLQIIIIIIISVSFLKVN